MKVKRQAVQWIDEPDKTRSKGFGDEDLDVKPGEDKLVGKRGADKLDVQKLELEQPQDLKEGTQKVFPDPEEETREVPFDPGEETRKVALDSKVETREAPSDPDEETREAPLNPEKGTQEVTLDSEENIKDVAGLVEGSAYLEGLVVPARQKIITNGNLPRNNDIGHVESTDSHGREIGSVVKVSAEERGTRREECVDVRRRGLNNFAEEGGDTGAVNRQQEMNALEMGECRKIRRKKKMARPNDKLVVGASVIYKKNMKDGEVEKYRCSFVA